MAYDEVLASRVRDLAAMDLREKSAFGARCWMADGNMAFGVVGDDLLVRLGQEGDALGLAHFDPTRNGKGFADWFIVPGEDVAEDGELVEWLGRAEAFARALPPK